MTVNGDDNGEEVRRGNLTGLGFSVLGLRPPRVSCPIYGEQSHGVIVGVDDTGVEVVVEDGEESGEDEGDLERRGETKNQVVMGTMRSNFRTKATVHRYVA